MYLSDTKERKKKNPFLTNFSRSSPSIKLSYTHACAYDRIQNPKIILPNT